MEPGSEGTECFLAGSTQLEYTFLPRIPPPHPASVVPEGPRGGSDWLEDLGVGAVRHLWGKAILTYSEDEIQK